MHAEAFIAALADSRGHELTSRRPCNFNHGNPVADFNAFDFREPGIAEVMLVFCADCGELVTHRRMNIFYSYEHTEDFIQICGYPTSAVPFDQRLRPRGES